MGLAVGLVGFIVCFFGGSMAAAVKLKDRACIPEKEHGGCPPPKKVPGTSPKSEKGGFMKKLVKILGGITEVFNIIALVALAAMLLLVCANVIMRYIFKNPIPGTYEMTKALMVCLTPCIAVNIMAKQCVWVDVVTAKFNRMGQLIVDIITLPFSIGIIGVMAWQGFNMILKSYEKGTYDAIMNFRLMEWPFRIIYFVAMAAATLAAVAFTVERFSMYKDGGVPHDETDTDRAIAAAGDLSAPAAADTIDEIEETVGRRISGCGQIPRKDPASEGDNKS